MDDYYTSTGHRRLKAPTEHGASLQVPAVDRAQALLTQNAIGRNSTFDRLNQRGIDNIDRQEVVSRARRYSNQYRDVDFEGRNQDQIIMSGHQPTLFHPGVWFKNFALSHLGENLNCVAINLVVDNDICGVASINAPLFRGDQATYQILATDAPGDNIPYEERGILDWSIFSSFGKRAAAAIRPLVQRPIVSQLWPKTVSCTRDSSLGAAISRGRHKYEEICRLATLEIPVSEVARTIAFAKFAYSILVDIKQFAKVYNQSLVEYRSLHRIRSNSHPVPALTSVDGWHETPFWIWQKVNPVRRSLFVRQSGKTIIAGDRRKLNLPLPVKSFESRFVELNDLGIAIRPKALLTTMFSRMILCDLFIHGIGGSKYDQLSDQIIRKFYGVQPPEYMTLTATMKLRPDMAEIGREQISQAENIIRELEFHPENFVDASAGPANRIVKEKFRWIAQDPPPGQRMVRHLGITQCNAMLQPLVAAKRTQIQRELQQLQAGFRSSQILGSREYSFCLHDENIVEQLHQMAN